LHHQINLKPKANKMKKTTFLIVLTAAASVVAFQSCNSKSKANGDLQNPTSIDSSASSKLTGNDKEDDGNNGTTSGTKDAVAKNFENMQAAFKGETTASAKYAEYSKKAETEGYHEIAMLFKAASTSEKIHANNHKAVLEDAGKQVPLIKPEFSVNSTKENLKDAIAGESYEISTMYPEFITNANYAGNQLSLISLNYAYKTEQKHKPLYEKALAALENNTVKSLATDYFVCPTCGNTYDNAAPKRCGISMTSGEKFIKIS
jgi:rubrerythrin